MGFVRLIWDHFSFSLLPLTIKLEQVQAKKHTKMGGRERKLDGADVMLTSSLQGKIELKKEDN